MKKIRDWAYRTKRYIGAISLALSDKRTPFISKVFAFLAFCYACSPIDLIPDFVPVLGYLDDLLILPALIGLSMAFMPRELFDELLSKSDGLKIEKKWSYALGIVLIYVFIVIYLCRIFVL